MAVGFKQFDENEERERLRKLSDAELIREGKSGRRGICEQKLRKSVSCLSDGLSFCSA